MDPNANTQTKIIERDLDRLGDRFDRHLEIYAQNGKELAALKSEVYSLKDMISAATTIHNHQDGRITKLEIDMGRLAAKVGIYASIGSTIGASIVVFLVEVIFK